MKVDKDKNIGSAVVDRETEHRPKLPVKETTQYSVVIYRVRTFANSERVSKESEIRMTPAQERLWFELSNLTTDEPTRLSMLSAALRVKDEMLDQVLEKVDIDPETRAIIREKLLQRRRQLTRGFSSEIQD